MKKKIQGTIASLQDIKAKDDYLRCDPSCNDTAGVDRQS